MARGPAHVSEALMLPLQPVAIDRSLPLHPVNLAHPLILKGDFDVRAAGDLEVVLWWAAHGNEASLVQALAADPAVDVNRCDAHGATPFYAACHEGHIETVMVMANLRGVVDVNKGCSGCMGASPFWTACSRGHVGVVEFLCQAVHGCDVGAANKHGVRPIDAARRGGHAAVVKALTRHAAGTADARRKAQPQLAAPQLPQLAAAQLQLAARAGDEGASYQSGACSAVSFQSGA
ncbi:ankyrin repeat-containing domain protein [Pelagophyceae sp. CCMP2097]|nr:ankyrin repeat-containing domain protein [Pelagophyceae sp. CCMP2097]|mmetsp:Transcript_13532/g.47123  ORF Transcript_13532/g.47123 Transcript_13532/m.47123 type:complete len:234 (-) Transcript_13532:106-807(-)